MELRNKKLKDRENHPAKKNITPEQIRQVQASSNLTIEEYSSLLGISPPTYKKYCDLYGISRKSKIHKPEGISKPKKQRVIKNPKNPKNPFRLNRPLDLILQNKYDDVPSGYLKRLLIRSGIKEDKCELCGIEQKRECDNKTPTLMKFLDDNKKNYNIGNLQIICFNCNFLYYEEWSLKKILERTEKKKMKCEIVIKTENDITGNNKSDIT